jgi:hypothetical protein
VARTAVVAVKTAAFENNADVPEHLPKVPAAVGTLGESSVLERLHDFEMLSA